MRELFDLVQDLTSQLRYHLLHHGGEFDWIEALANAGVISCSFTFVVKSIIGFLRAGEELVICRLACLGDAFALGV